MKHLNFSTKSGSRSCGHSSVTLASTVGSPSAHRRGAMLRLLSVLVLVLTVGVGNVWGATATLPNTQALTTSFANVGTDTNVRIKTSSANTYTNPLRFYANVTTTIQVATGYTIKSVTYEASSTGNYVTYAQNATVSPSVTPTVSGKNVKWTFDSGTAEFTFTPSTQTRANSITVVYEEVDACTNNITIDKGSETNGTFTLSKSGSQATCSGLSVEVTPTPSTHYHVASVTATTPTTGGAPTVTGPSAGKYTVAYAANSTGSSTINVTFAADPQYTVNWYVNGSVAHSQTGYEGASLTSIPTPTSSDCDGSKVFVGWYTSTYSHTSEAPAYVSPTTIPNGGANYYAVFADVSGSTTTYDLITTAAGLVAGEQYVIGHKTSGGSYYYMPNTASSSNPTLSSMTITGTQITSTVIDAMLWTLRTSDVSGYGYKWESVANSSNFLATATSTGNNIRVGTSSSFSMNSWSISVDATYGWILKSNGTYTSSQTTYTGKYAVIYGDSEWRVYSANSTNAQAGAKFVIFKKNTAATYSNYATSCCTQLGQINGSFFWTIGKGYLTR